MGDCLCDSGVIIKQWVYVISVDIIFVLAAGGIHFALGGKVRLKFLEMLDNKIKQLNWSFLLGSEMRRAVCVKKSGN